MYSALWWAFARAIIPASPLACGWRSQARGMLLESTAHPQIGVKRPHAMISPQPSANASSNTSLAKSIATVTAADDSSRTGLVIACMANSSRDPWQDGGVVMVELSKPDGERVASIRSVKRTAGIGYLQSNHYRPPGLSVRHQIAEERFRHDLL